VLRVWVQLPPEQLVELVLLPVLPLGKVAVRLLVHVPPEQVRVPEVLRLLPVALFVVVRW
jgi:hypothetical protein